MRPRLLKVVSGSLDVRKAGNQKQTNPLSQSSNWVRALLRMPGELPEALTQKLQSRRRQGGGENNFTLWKDKQRDFSFGASETLNTVNDGALKRRRFYYHTTLTLINVNIPLSHHSLRPASITTVNASLTPPSCTQRDPEGSSDDTRGQ